MKRVRDAYYLQWPTSFGSPQLPRGGPGTIIDETHPLELERDADGTTTGGWLKGQEHKLEDAPADAVATPIVLPQALGKLRLWEQEQSGIKPEEPEPVAATVEANAAAESADPIESIPKPQGRRKKE